MNQENKKMGLDSLPKYTPSTRLWSNLEKELDGEKNKKISWWYSVGGIAASILIAMFVGYTLSNQVSEHETIPIVQNIIEPVISEPINTKPPTLIPDTNSLTSDDQIDAQPITSIDASPEIFILHDSITLFSVDVPTTHFALSCLTPSKPIISNGAATSYSSPPNDYITSSGADISTYSAFTTPTTFQWNSSSYGSGTFNANGFVNIKGNKPLINKERKIKTYNAADGRSSSIESAPGRDYLNKIYQCIISDSIVFGSLGDYNTESYAEQVENDFMTPDKDPLSTFAIDVDNASYAVMRNKLNNNILVPKNSVRIEEYINYFSYNYKKADAHPFSINTEMAQCPWNEERQLIHIGLQGKQIDYKNTKSSNLVFLLDVSGSMGEKNKLPLVKKSMNMLVEKMGKKDKIAIVTYAGAAGLSLESTTCDRKDFIAKKIKHLDAGGSTAGGEGIKLAYKVALENLIAEGNNRIILCTDGDFNVGESSDAAMEDLIISYRDKGIFITVCGFGMGNYQDSKMETIADNGNGNYFYIDTYREANKVFNRELTATLFTIAKDVKVQVEFNPAYVKAYRLVGYENRVMPAQDFNDDTKDGGELGAGHTVTALYEIIPAASTEKINNIDLLKYQKVIKEKDLIYNNEAVTVKLRYKKPKENISKLMTRSIAYQSTPYQQTSENFRFSAGVALYASTLRQSKYTNDLQFALSSKLITGALGNDPNGDRAELLRLIEKARNAYGTTSKK